MSKASENYTNRYNTLTKMGHAILLQGAIAAGFISAIFALFLFIIMFLFCILIIPNHKITKNIIKNNTLRYLISFFVSVIISALIAIIILFVIVFIIDLFHGPFDW